MIPKGTVVRVLTTNGGDTVATLAEDYRQTFDCVLTKEGHTFVIINYRVKSVTSIDEILSKLKPRSN